MIFEDKQIKDICKFVGGSQPPKSEFIHEYREGYVRLIQIRDRLNDKFITYIPEESTNKFCDVDDILIGRYGPPIFQIFRGFKGAYNVAIMKAVPLEGIDNDYLYYFLLQEAVFNYVDSMSARTAGQTGVELDSLYEYPVKLPCLNDQKRIAKVLKLLDNKIALNDEAYAKLEEVAKTVYNYWFTQFDFPNEKNKPYRASDGLMEWNETLKKEIPRGWKTTTIGEITNCLDSKRIPLSSSERENIKGTIPYYGATDIMGYVNDFIFDGDYVLMAEDGSIMDDDGHPILQRITGKTWVNNHAHVLEPIKGFSCKLLMMILSDLYVPMIKTGSIQMKINQDNMNKVVVLDIPDDLKERMNVTLNKIERKQLEIREENILLSSVRDFLIPLFMNGQIDFT